jgi:hypothetical protein
VLAERPVRDKPHADTIVVEDLVKKFLAGQIRVPSFQRALKWGAKDVARLLDSVYRGFPIGSLLMWKRSADAQRIRIGPFDIEVGARGDAWLVVDGQQRLISLAAALCHPAGGEEDAEPDIFTVLFDLVEDRFRLPQEPIDAKSRPFLVPVHRLFDAVDLAEWLATHPTVGSDRELARRAHAVGKALREYRVPVYVIETEDEDVIREVFERVNTSGVALTQAEVFDALVGSRRGPVGSGERLTDLVAELGQLGMGTIDEELAFRLVLGVEGLDVTRSFQDFDRNERQALRGATPKASAAVRMACELLRADAAVPHLRLLPYSWPLVVLTRFFHVHPHACARSRDLLSRWLWRGVVRGPGAMDERTLLRRAIQAIAPGGQSEEDTVQVLLPLVPSEPEGIRYELPARFDARTAPSRIAMAALADNKPRNLDDGSLIDVATLVDQHDVHAFARLVVGGGEPTGSVGNRALHGRRDGGLFEHVHARGTRDPHDRVLRSHAIDEDAAKLATEGDRRAFIVARERAVRVLIAAFLHKMTRFGYGDRPSISSLMEAAQRAVG